MSKIYSIDELISLISPIAKDYGVKRSLCLALMQWEHLPPKVTLIY